LQQGKRRTFVRRFLFDTMNATHTTQGTCIIVLPFELRLNGAECSFVAEFLLPAVPT
jgi:hypothetical protein